MNSDTLLSPHFPALCVSQWVTVTRVKHKIKEWRGKAWVHYPTQSSGQGQRGLESFLVAPGIGWESTAWLGPEPEDQCHEL